MDLFLYSEPPRRLSLIDSASDVVMLSNVLHKSITHLDISIREMTKKLKTVTTETSLHRFFNKNNPVIGHLNLDSPLHFDHRFECVPFPEVMVPEGAPNTIKYINILPKAYHKHFFNELVLLVERSNDKLKTLRRCVDAIERIELCHEVTRPSFGKTLLNFFIQEKCDDSQLVVKFLKACGGNIITWILVDENTDHMLDYILFHCQRTRFDLFDFEPFIKCPLIYSISIGRVPAIELLLKYGYSLPERLGKPNRSYYLSLPHRENREPSPIQFKPTPPVRRKVLLFEVVSLSRSFKTRPSGLPRTLELLWRSRPDCHLRMDEFRNSFDSVDDHFETDTFLTCLWSFYASACPDAELDRPRTLLQLSRCEIRRSLANNYALPDGIESLGVPNGLKSYLRLEY